jgi:hypothetical protein
MEKLMAHILELPDTSILTNVRYNLTSGVDATKSFAGSRVIFILSNKQLVDGRKLQMISSTMRILSSEKFFVTLNVTTVENS